MFDDEEGFLSATEDVLPPATGVVRQREEEVVEPATAPVTKKAKHNTDTHDKNDRYNALRRKKRRKIYKNDPKRHQIIKKKEAKAARERREKLRQNPEAYEAYQKKRREKDQEKVVDEKTGEIVTRGQLRYRESQRRKEC